MEYLRPRSVSSRSKSRKGRWEEAEDCLRRLRGKKEELGLDAPESVIEAAHHHKLDPTIEEAYSKASQALTQPETSEETRLLCSALIRAVDAIKQS